jgi:hypothetical protein
MLYLCIRDAFYKNTFFERGDILFSKEDPPQHFKKLEAFKEVLKQFESFVKVPLKRVGQNPEFSQIVYRDKRSQYYYLHDGKFSEMTESEVIKVLNKLPQRVTSITLPKGK